MRRISILTILLSLCDIHIPPTSIFLIKTSLLLDKKITSPAKKMITHL
jgi:hypothetical protein